MRRTILPAARRDVLLQGAYLIEVSAEDAASRFPDAVGRAINQLVRQPGIGSPVALRNPRLAGLRSWPVPAFEDFRIYYLQPTAQAVRVVRVLHGKRNVAAILERERP